MTLVALIAIVLVVLAITKSASKLRTLGVILGWTLGVATSAGLLTFVVALMLRAGNPGAVSGDIAGPAFTLTLLFSSAGQLRASKRGTVVTGSGGSTAVSPPPSPAPK